MTNKIEEHIYPNKFEFDDEESGYSCNGEYWKSTTLYKAAEEQGCKPYILPLKFIDMSYQRWNKVNVIWMAHFYKRITETDIAIPILIGPEGDILDGYHRVTKALVLGHKNVKAVRLKKMPPKDRDD